VAGRAGRRPRGPAGDLRGRGRLRRGDRSGRRGWPVKIRTRPDLCSPSVGVPGQAELLEECSRGACRPCSWPGLSTRRGRRCRVGVVPKKTRAPPFFTQFGQGFRGPRGHRLHPFVSHQEDLVRPRAPAIGRSRAARASTGRPCLTSRHRTGEERAQMIVRGARVALWNIIESETTTPTPRSRRPRRPRPAHARPRR